MSQLSDGEYTIEVTLSGGSGRASVQSPAKLDVTDGRMKAEIQWSSGSYDYMEVDGKSYRPVNEEGNSRFVIDVETLDEELPVLAETVAMSEPHTIAYTLRFDPATVRSAGGHFGPVFWCTGGAVLLLAAAAAILSAKRAKKKQSAKAAGESAAQKSKS